MDGGLLAALADLLLPRTCAGCGLPGALLCRRCARLLTVPHLAQPRRFPVGFPPTVAAGAYAGPVRPAVNAFKERGRAELARPLGAALALAVAGVVAGLDGGCREVRLVPVPSSRAALRVRGRDHVRELTGRAVAELRAAGVPAAPARLLRRTGRVRDSAGLSADQRRANLAGTFALVPGAAAVGRDGVLVLVDDVVTSGATLTEAAAALAPAAVHAGPPVLAAVVAATPRRVPLTGPGADRRGQQGRLSGPGNGD
ncbi:ComF family protein [Geodermatophilus sp. CPCC 206100]|uniref:ComF family protein n=1 Tax=Geodermatophilus sp. CPCC 206100 TaxID=3020054 RepID=UPI003B00A457